MVYDGRAGWGRGAEYGPTFDLVLALEGDDLYAAGLEAALSFSGRIKASAHPMACRPSIASTIATSRSSRHQRRGNSREVVFQRSRACWCGFCAIPTCRSAVFPRRLTSPTIARFPASRCLFIGGAVDNGELNFDLNEIRLNVL